MAKYNNIKAELERKGLKVSDLAEYMELSVQAVQYKLNGRGGVCLRDMVDIELFLEKAHGHRFSLDYLFEPFE